MSHPPRIFYHCYDHNRPTGGETDTYQHVDILNRNGIEAYAAHGRSGFRLDWFDDDTVVIDDKYFREIFKADRDFIVLPEDLGIKTMEYPGRKVIFNKTLYAGARAVATTLPAYDPYPSPDVVAVFAVSEHNRRSLQFAYPSKPVHLVRYDIRPQIFRYRPLSSKRALIACVPKALAHVTVLYQLLRARAISGPSPLARFDWIFLRGLSEAQVAAVLSDTLIFIFLSVEEGLPRMPLEAIASGCLVTAYATGPLLEHLPHQYGFSHGDLVSIAAHVERIAARYPNLDELQEVAVDARRISLSFSAGEQNDTFMTVWRTILEGSRPKPPTLSPLLSRSDRHGG